MSAIHNRADAQPNPKLPLSWDNPNAPDTSPAPTADDTPSPREPELAPATAEAPAAPSPQELAPTAADAPTPQEPARATVTPDETPEQPQERQPDGGGGQPQANLPEPQNETAPLPEQPAADQADELPSDSETRPEGPAEIVSYRPPAETVSKTLQRIRAEAGVPISEVSHKTHISATFISDLEAANFAALPDLDQCLDKIRQLCTEYGADTDALLEKFRQEYAEFLKDSQQEPEHAGVMGRRPNAGVIRSPGLSTSPQRMASLPSLILLGVILLLAAILLYAFFAYQSRRLPPRTDTDFTQFVPMHRPQVILLDEQR